MCSSANDSGMPKSSRAMSESRRNQSEKALQWLQHVAIKPEQDKHKMSLAGVADKTTRLSPAAMLTRNPPDDVSPSSVSSSTKVSGSPLYRRSRVIDDTARDTGTSASSVARRRAAEACMHGGHARCQPAHISKCQKI